MYSVKEKSIILDSLDNVIGAGLMDSEYFVFKASLSISTSTTINCIIPVPNLKRSEAYTIISDGGTGYYATGFIKSNNNVETGMLFTHYSSTLTPNWEIAPFGLTSFTDKIEYLSLSSGYLWGCGKCDKCSDSDNNAVFTRLTAVGSTLPASTDLESM